MLTQKHTSEALVMALNLIQRECRRTRRAARSARCHSVTADRFANVASRTVFLPRRNGISRR